MMNLLHIVFTNATGLSNAKDLLHHWRNSVDIMEFLLKL